ncbi:MAG: DUF2889 domain-containing protein, partial [Myxococcota bacterium]
LAVAFTQGEGGAVEFRADLMDLRKAGLMSLGDRITMAGIIHKMELRGTFSAETGSLESIQWDQSHVMHEPNHASKGECCRDPLGRLKELIGVQLGLGFAATLKQIFGGPLGCTHISTLFQELSAFVARLGVMRAAHPELISSRRPGERIATRSLYFDAFLPSEGGSETDISVRLADLFYAIAAPSGAEVLFEHDELRLVAQVDLAGWQFKSGEARERCRRGPTCENSSWTLRSDALSDFAGQSLGGGMARLCLQKFGDSDADARLLSALLSLGPGMTQVGAAVSDTLAPSSSAAPPGSGLPGPGPCYMLRTGGPLIESMFSGGLMSKAEKGE